MTGQALPQMLIQHDGVNRIPPTKAALEQHVRGAVFQGGHIWGKAINPHPALPSPTAWGWRKMDDGLYQPLRSTLPEAAKSCQELVSCGCKKVCQKRCRCNQATLPYTGLCSCDDDLWAPRAPPSRWWRPRRPPVLAMPKAGPEHAFSISVIGLYYHKYFQI